MEAGRINDHKVQIAVFSQPCLRLVTVAVSDKHSGEHPSITLWLTEAACIGRWGQLQLVRTSVEAAERHCDHICRVQGPF